MAPSIISLMIDNFLAGGKSEYLD